MISTKPALKYLAAAVIIYILLAHNRCVDTSWAWFRILRGAGVDDLCLCSGTVDGEDFDHVWLRVNGYNVETATLNLFKTPKIDYDNPYFISDVEEHIMIELFSDHHWEG